MASEVFNISGGIRNLSDIRAPGLCKTLMGTCVRPPTKGHWCVGGGSFSAVHRTMICKRKICIIYFLGFFAKYVWQNCDSILGTSNYDQNLGEKRKNCTITGNAPHCKQNIKLVGKGEEKIVQFSCI